MSIAKKCDRCGKLYEQYNTKNSDKQINGIMTLNIDCKQSCCKHGPYDLCPECSKKLMDWLTNGKGERKSTDSNETYWDFTR